MANNNQNDIVVNAKANTKEAEANIKKLDAQIQTMVSKDQRLTKLDGSLSKVGSKAKAAATSGAGSAKACSISFAAMSGSLTGVITKLGAVGVAIGAVIALQNALKVAQADYAKSVDAMGKAEENAINAKAARTKDAINALEQLNNKAKESPLDADAIKLENNLVQQLNDTWGDVGISINQATGEVKGLLQATQKINAEIRNQRLAALSKQIEAAQLELDNARSTYNEEYEENGDQKISLNGIGNNIRATGEGLVSLIKGEGFEQGYNRRVDTRANEYRAAVSDAEGRLNELIAQRDALAKEASAEDAARILQQNETRQKAEADIAKSDPREQELIRALAQAQMTGGDVEGAKSELDSYLEQRNRDRYNELSSMVGSDQSAIAAAQKAYDEAKKTGDNAAIAEAAKALARVTEIASQHTNEMAKIANGMYKPAITAPENVRSASQGTFDAFGANGIGNNTIMQQQLDVQKKIEKNTEELAKPVVGE